MKEVPSFIPIGNGDLHDYVVEYRDHTVPFSGIATDVHIVRQSKSIRNALASFNRAVPKHGPIKSIRQVVAE